MTADEHYKKAMDLLRRAESLSGSDRLEHRNRETALIATAQVHATLSLGEDRPDVTVEIPK